MSCEVIVLFDGYSNKLSDTIMEANCSCVLIKSSKNIIVDTMTAWDKKRLLKALEVNNVCPENIDYVVCTHSHSDHTGNNNLFTEAEHILGNCAQRGTTFYDRDISKQDYQLCEGAKVIASPGHTAEDITVVVTGKLKGEEGVIAITGDLFEKEEDITNPVLWKEVGMPDLHQIQTKSRSKIASFADFIIPGHGPPFRITEAIREILQRQSEISPDLF